MCKSLHNKIKAVVIVDGVDSYMCFDTVDLVTWVLYYGTEWPILCWSTIKKLLTQSSSVLHWKHLESTGFLRL